MVKFRFAQPNLDQLANRALGPLAFGFITPFKHAAIEESTRIANDANNLTTLDTKSLCKATFIILVDCEGLLILLNHCGTTGVTLFPNNPHYLVVFSIARTMAQQWEMLCPTCTQATGAHILWHITANTNQMFHSQLTAEDLENSQQQD